MMKCWEDSYCVWGNPAATGRSGRVLRCRRIPPEDRPGAKEEQHLQRNNPKLSLWFTALMNWPKLRISDSYPKEQTEQQTLRSNLTYNHFACELIRGIVCCDPHPPPSTRPLSLSLTWLYLYEHFHRLMNPGGQETHEHVSDVLKTHLFKRQTLFSSPDNLWTSGLVQRRSTVRHRRRFLPAGWIPAGWIQSCSRDTMSPIHDSLC